MHKHLRYRIYVPAMPRLKDLQVYLKRIDESRIYSNSGPLNLELIRRLSQTFNITEHQICLLNNATSALQAAISTSNFEGSWICPSWSFAATGQALLNQKIPFEFGDINQDWRLNTARIKPQSAILDVAPFGDELPEIDTNKFHGHYVVDAAASFDAISRNGNIPKYQNSAVVLSLHATKLIGAGEGGAFISRSEDWVIEVKNWSNFGFSSSDRDSYMVGTNAKMSEYAAAVALASLDIWPSLRNQFLEITSAALDIALDSGLDVHPAMRKGYVTPYWIIVSDESRILRIEKLLASQRIETRRWWSRGMHKMRAFKNVKRTKLTNSDQIARVTLGLPFHLFLDKEYFKEIRELLKKTI